MSTNLFNSIRVRPPKRNRFDLSHGVKTTLKFGELVPILCQPVLPGDTFKLNTEILARFAPFQAPIMHKVKIYTHFFFVPNRLVWDNWKEFITGGEDGTSAPPFPRLVASASSTNSSYIDNGSLWDYLGLPSYDPNIHVDGRVFYADALPFRAYQLIYNEYYRDENLTDPVEIGKDVDGNITLHASDKNDLGRNLMTIRKRSWKKDYFTSALPFAQRGDDVTLPLYGEASLDFNEGQISRLRGDAIDEYRYGTGGLNMYQPANGPATFIGGKLVDSNGNDIVSGNDSALAPDDVKVGVDLNVGHLKNLISGIDLSNVSAATINEFRRALAAQNFLEAMARGGSRYIEQLYSIFGVRSSDARLQRPEYLGGGSSPVVISDVLQTSQSTEGNPLGTPGGHGVSVQQTHSFKRFFEEHGWVIGIMSVMPMPAYQQGMPRTFQKYDRLDYYWPQFAHLGEQEITEGEIFYQGYPDYDEELFGYTPRYAEYKYIPDSVHGDFRGNLSFWHMGRIFTAPPRLNDDFLTNVQDAANRPFSVEDTAFDKIWVNIHHNLKAMRKMPVYGTPRL